MGWIYKITCTIDNRVYIGKTEESNPYNRWKSHLKACRSKQYKSIYLYNAMNKYGIENFQFELLEEFNDGIQLCEAEMKYIKQYRSFIGFEDCNGFNMTLGGDGSPMIDIPDEQIVNYYYECRSVRKVAKYFNISQDTVIKYLHRNNVRVLSNIEHIENEFIERHGGIVMIDYENNVICDILSSLKCVKQKYNFNTRTVNKALRKTEKYHSGKSHGYKWFYLNELPEEYKPLLQEYYASHLEEDNLEIADDLEYIYC